MIKQSVRLSKGLKQQLNFKTQKNIVNPNVLMNPKDKHKHKQYDLYHLVGERQGNIAILKLNREYKHNLLTITMIQELKRFLASYELDPTIRAIQIEGQAGKIVSKGTDYSFLVHNQQNKNFKQNEEYLRELQELAFQLSKYDKPLITNINGATHNSAAALFTSSPFTFPSKSTYLQFDDINYGMTPQMGSSYQLSRLPYQLGRFLALTGEPLRGKQVYQSGFGGKYLSNSKNFTQNLLGAHQQYDDTFTSQELYSDQYLEDKMKHDASKDVFYEGIKQEINDKIMSTDGQAYENGKLEMAQILYKKQAVEQANNQQTQFSRLGYKNQKTINHLQQYKEQVIDQLDILNFEIVDENMIKSINKLPLKLINRCFSSNTVEGIIENLQKEQENQQFCQKVIEQLQSKNKMALKLTLELLKQGQTGTWLECLQQEFRVAAKRSQDADFATTADHAFKQFYQEESTNPDLITKLEQISQEQVNQYFEKDENIEEFGQEKIQDGLYPVREFYEKYPNVIRSFLNEESLNDLELQRTQDFDIKNFLHSQNIDFLRSWTLDTPTLRSQIYAKEFQQQQLKLQVEKLHNLATDSTSIELYSQKKRDYVQNYLNQSNEKTIRNQVNDTIGEVFEQYFDKRMENLKNISSKAFISKKQEYFLKIRKTLFDSRLVTSDEQQHSEVKNLFNENTPVDLRFPEKNSQTIYDAQAQIVESSPIFNLIQEIKNQNPENQKILKGLNIDHTKVQEILDEIEAKSKYDSIQFGTEGEFNQSKIRNFDKRIKEYNQRFGDPFEDDKNIYLDNLIQHYGNKNENISQFLQQYSTEQVREMIIKEQNSQDYRLFGENLLNQLDSKKSQQEQILKQLQQDTQNQALIKTQKELVDQQESYTKLVDLQIQQNKEQQQKSEQISGLQQYLKNDKEMKSILSIFETEKLQEQQTNTGLNQMKERFNKILENIYESKLNQILKQEKQQNMNQVKVTRDGKSIFNTFNASGPGGDLYMKIVDDFIDGNLQQDFHNYISSHIFFTFAAVGLQELSELFKVLFNISRKFNLNVSDEDSVQKLKSMMQTIQNTLGVNITSGEDINNIVGFLSEATEQLCLIYLMYKDKLIFPEDKILKISQSAKYIKERDYDDLSFANYVLTAYQEQVKNQEEQLKETQDLYEISRNDQEQLQSYLQKEFNIENDSQNKDIVMKVQKEINTLNSFKSERTLVQSAVLYIEKLDLLTQNLIHGKDHFLPQEQKEVIEHLPAILEHIDLSIESEQWVQHKLKKYIESLFEIRYKFERQATKNQLVLFDMQLAQYLEPEYLQNQMEYELSQEVSHIKILGDIFNTQKQQIAGSNPLLEKYQKEKKEVQASIKNFDAQKKLLAFQIMQLNNKNNLENQGQQQKKIPQLKKKKDKSTNDRIKNEIKKAKFKQQLNSLNDIWITNDRLNQEQNEVQPNTLIDTQQLYREILGIQDFSMDEQEQQSQNNKKVQQYQFTKEEVLIPLENIVNDQQYLINDPLRQEIQGFINQMK